MACGNLKKHSLLPLRYRGYLHILRPHPLPQPGKKDMRRDFPCCWYAVSALLIPRFPADRSDLFWQKQTGYREYVWTLPEFRQTWIVVHSLFFLRIFMLLVQKIPYSLNR